MLAEHFDTTVSIVSLIDGSNDTEVFSTTVLSLRCQIQPLDDSFDEDLSGSYGKDFLMFSGISTIKQGDKVYDGSDYYAVRGVESYSFNGFQHIETRISKVKE